MVTYNIEIREFNGIDYDVLYPKTTINNVDGLSAKISQLDTMSNDITAMSSDITTIKNNISALDANKQNKLTFDTAPRTNSNNPVTSSGILTALNTKQDKSSLGSLALKDKATLTNGNDVTGVLPVANGGTGNANGTVNKLTTARTIRTNLASTSTASFDGSANVTPGVTGVLPVANGGTNANNAKDALTNLGITISNTTISEGDTLASGSIYIYYE